MMSNLRICTPRDPAIEVGCSCTGVSLPHSSGRRTSLHAVSGRKARLAPPAEKWPRRDAVPHASAILHVALPLLVEIHNRRLDCRFDEVGSRDPVQRFGQYRGERCADCSANRATIERARPTRAGQSAGSVNDAARSFGKPRVGDEARRSPPAGRHGSENWRRQKRKGQRKESSSWSHKDLMNARTLCVFEGVNRTV